MQRYGTHNVLLLIKEESGSLHRIYAITLQKLSKEAAIKSEY